MSLQRFKDGKEVEILSASGNTIRYRFKGETQTYIANSMKDFVKEKRVNHKIKVKPENIKVVDAFVFDNKL